MGLFKRTRTRYVDRETGKRSKKDAPGGVKKQVRSKDWYGTYRDANGIIREERLCSNKEAARHMLTELEREAERQRSGTASPFAEHAKRPLVVHLEDFEKNLRHKGNTEDYCRLKRGRAEAVMTGCRFRYPGDISASRVQEYLAELKKSRSQQTVNHYLTAVKQFTRWMVRDHRIGEDRLVHLQGGNVKLDQRHPRRELTSDELAKLFEATRNGPARKPLTGEQRFLLYAMAVGTGLRASELASLTPGHFDLDAEMPTVSIKAEDEKARRGDLLPLSAELVELLRPYLDTLAPAERLWPGPWAEQKRAGKWLQADLEIAGVPYETEAGFADFHALRHTFCSQLGRSGATIKEAMELARHTTPQMTMRYMHANIYDLASAVNRLPSLSPGESESKAEAEPAALRSTGTEESRPVVTRLATRPDAQTRGPVRPVEETDLPETENEKRPQSLPLRAFADD